MSDNDTKEVSSLNTGSNLTKKDLKLVTTKIAESINIVDRSLLSVPYELLSASIKEIEHLLEKKLLIVTTYLIKKVVNIEDKNLLKEKLARALERLQQIKDQIKKIDDDMDRNLSNLYTRLNELKNEPDLYINQINPNFNFDTYRKRVSWMLGEYLSRKCFTSTVSMLVETENIKEFVDLEIHENCNKIIDDLMQHDLTSALNWAEENKNNLSKINSTLLYELRLQKIISILKSGTLNQVLELINQFITHEVLMKCPDAKKIITAAIFYTNEGIKQEKQDDFISYTSTVETLVDIDPKGGEIDDRYRYLMSDQRWNKIIDEFGRTISKIYGFREKSILEDLIQAGFSAIKSKGCRDYKNPTCPACLPEWASYVEQIPNLHKLQSILICPITGTIMDYSNPPLASPDGYVISKNALKFLNRNNNNDDYIICPKTNKTIHISDFKKIFIT
ncbi:CTLH/CRA C-terminal to LisH motif domain protein [Theileria parva strain Muguga]|uniref:CTLH domain-containing protein n=1 Tax=Theileria parva TaxID=5875 RepID=Q4N010_THEPA|nr:CTLH/CRA C-terminal to LisH motif domain protein [Theileria parva strain Muguga]EAN31079.1 CTLH/CRA C-terminal to LisH motif domain protein [Theileria parva strain Muguga]|eukprot:XP_763362.1 hypothetical protein [Theileria parva strain Muguga]